MYDSTIIMSQIPSAAITSVSLLEFAEYYLVIDYCESRSSSHRLDPARCLKFLLKCISVSTRLRVRVAAFATLVAYDRTSLIAHAQDLSGIHCLSSHTPLANRAGGG